MFCLNDLVLTKGIATTPKFSSNAERIEFSADIISDSFDIDYRIFSYDASGTEKQIAAGESLFSGKLFHIKSNFDPVYFGVYGEAKSFKVEFFSRSLSEFTVKAFSLIEKTHSREGGYEDDDSVGPAYAAPDKVLFVGNSLLLGMFGKYGMCATAPDKDYFYYVSEHIKSFSPYCEFERIRGAQFEGLSSPDAFEKCFYSTDDPTKRPFAESFKDDVDLIFIQLGDNVNTEEKEAVFKTTAFTLVDAIKKHCPKARIVWIFGWYNWDRTYDTIQAVKKKYGIETIDIEFFNTPQNRSEHGQISVGRDGEPVVVDDYWITHPGDKGFKEIADKIIKKLNFNQ